jgi:hypothetical protein
VGTFPEKHSRDYCWGGCPGALQEAMHIFRAYYPNVEKDMQKIHYVVGHVDGPLEIDDDEKVIFAGNCTSWEGKIGDEAVKIESSYKTASQVDEKKTRSNDMLLKTVKTIFAAYFRKTPRYVHAKGCPLSVGDHVHYLSVLGGIKNVNFDPRLVFTVNLAYWTMRFKRFVNHILT